MSARKGGLGRGLDLLVPNTISTPTGVAIAENNEVDINSKLVSSVSSICSSLGNEKTSVKSKKYLEDCIILNLDQSNPSVQVIRIWLP